MKRIRAIRAPLTSVLVLAGALVGGCASISEQECRASNWYEIGERDALVYGMRPRIDQYAHQCSRYGLQPDERQYLSGWQVGAWEHSIRVSGGVCCAR